jgi:WD40 repeat protein
MRMPCFSLVIVLAATSCVAADEPAPRLKSSWTEVSASVVLFSPDGKSIVSAGGEGHSLREAATGKIRAVLAAPRVPFSGARFSPDSQFLYAEVGATGHKVATQDLHVWDVATGKLRRTFPYVSEGIGEGRFGLSRDGRLLAFLDNSERLPMEVQTAKMTFDRQTVGVALNTSKGLPKVTIWDVERAEKRAQVDGNVPLAFSPDGKSLITGDRDWRTPVAKVWDTVTGKLRVELKDRPAGIWPIVVSPDGRYVATATIDRFLLWQLSDGKRWEVAINTRGTRKGEPSFSTDGKLCFPLGMPWINPMFGQKEQYYAFDLSNLPPKRIDLGEGELIFAPDGRRFAAARGERGQGKPVVVTLYSLPAVEELDSLDVAMLVGGSFSPDGRWLALLVTRTEAFGPAGHTRFVQEVHLVNTTAERILKIPSPGQTWGDFGWRFSPDGKLLAVSYRPGTNLVRRGEPEPNSRPMIVEVWELPDDGAK